MKNGPVGEVIFAALMPHAPVLVPGVGHESFKGAARTVAAMRSASNQLNNRAPQALVLISPHSPRKAGAFGIWGGKRVRGDFGQFGAPDVVLDLPTEPALAAGLQVQAAQAGLEIWKIPPQAPDHGALVPLWFLVEAGWQGPTVVLSLNNPGEPGLLQFGQALLRATRALQIPIALIASGDLSHRLTLSSPAGYEPHAREFDREFIAFLRRGDYHALERMHPYERNLAAEDAIDSVLVAAAALDWRATGHEVLSYEGPFGVGYGVAVLFDMGLSIRTGMAPCLSSH